LTVCAEKCRLVELIGLASECLICTTVCGARVRRSRLRQLVRTCRDRTGTVLRPRHVIAVFSNGKLVTTRYSARLSRIRRTRRRKGFWNFTRSRWHRTVFECSSCHVRQPRGLWRTTWNHVRERTLCDTDARVSQHRLRHVLKYDICVTVIWQRIFTPWRLRCIYKRVLCKTCEPLASCHTGERYINCYANKMNSRGTMIEQWKIKRNRL